MKPLKTIFFSFFHRFDFMYSYLFIYSFICIHSFIPYLFTHSFCIYSYSFILYLLLLIHSLFIHTHSLFIHTQSFFIYSYLVILYELYSFIPCLFIFTNYSKSFILYFFICGKYRKEYFSSCHIYRQTTKIITIMSHHKIHTVLTWQLVVLPAWLNVRKYLQGKVNSPSHNTFTLTRAKRMSLSSKEDKANMACRRNKGRMWSSAPHQPP
jgi:hypothetical protein